MQNIKNQKIKIMNMEIATNFEAVKFSGTHNQSIG